ncbi:MAG: peptidyl-prolyl cis-trans isomerase B (cyclophilin B) [Puniceicoccaceae bacterium 5H]|nr:MAG: peptidyl-prolyl cis-trans isomerase B (cyclophilin B) [Puniceicoccaceae bacterium 5H]
MTFRWIHTGLALLGLFLLAGCGSDKKLELFRPGDTPVWRTAADAPASPRSSRNQTQEDIEPMADNPQVTLKTSKGDITLELFADKAPITVENFLKYVENDHYDNTVFHRVIPGFMVQGGGMNADMQEKPTMAPIQNEAKNSVPNRRGTVAMARTNDLNSATSQFFINLVDNDFLNGNGITGGYAVFGRVIEGMDVVDAIAKVQTSSKGYHDDVPVEPIVIEDAVRIDE